MSNIEIRTEGRKSPAGPWKLGGIYTGGCTKVLFLILLCGADGSDQQAADISAELFCAVVGLTIDSVCFEQEF